VAWVSVAVPVPFLDLLTYRVPDEMAPPIRGARVSVPLGKRVVTGIVTGPAKLDDARVTKGGRQRSDAETKDLIAILDDEAFVPAAVVDLAMWVAEYYACGPGDALAAAMPPAKAHKTVGTVRLPSTVPGPGKVDTTEVKMTPRQTKAMELLRGAPAGLSVPALNERGVSTDVLRRLAAKGLVTFGRNRVERDPFQSGVVRSVVPLSTHRVLTDEQSQALDALRAAADTHAFAVSLLQGVTGSGKTEVYLRLASRVLEHGRTVLVLVPEIALTPAVASAFREAFGDQVAVQHSGLSEGERYDQWHRIRRGEVSIVVGTRSAVFAPLSGLGLIIVDEEHDTSFKQEETPRYHGRDVAVMRGKQEGALVVLGSATPSLESGQNAGAC
jgi:primosomal protein N' (replication factor Y)